MQDRPPAYIHREKGLVMRVCEPRRTSVDCRTCLRMAEARGSSPLGSTPFSRDLQVKREELSEDLEYIGTFVQQHGLVVEVQTIDPSLNMCPVLAMSSA